MVLVPNGIAVLLTGIAGSYVSKGHWRYGGWLTRGQIMGLVGFGGRVGLVPESSGGWWGDGLPEGLLPAVWLLRPAPEW